MIHDVADLLRAFANREVQTLEAAGIKHAPTIGKMYEGLTAEILSKSLPPGLNLEVVSGFITDGKDFLSGQIDCMLVVGEGEAIPYTDDFKWHVRDVVAVIEVKKNMFSKGMIESFEQLRGALDVHSHWIQDLKHGPSVNIGPSQRAFAEITGVIAPQHSSLNELPKELEYIYHTIVGDQFSPVRIALGYAGFKSEFSLRKGFIDFMQNKLGVHGYGPHSFPQLIVAGEASLVKLSGHPYRARMRKGGMLLMASSAVNPLLLMLELIWTRLTYYHSMPELFGEDLMLESFAPLLWAKLVVSQSENAQIGWQLTAEKITEAALEKASKFVEWEPDELSKEQYVVINMLCKGECVNIMDDDFISFIAESEMSVEEFVDSLMETSLVARIGNEIRLITEQCNIVVMPGGRFVAADNSTGRLTRWMEKYRNDLN